VYPTTTTLSTLVGDYGTNRQTCWRIVLTSVVSFWVYDTNVLTSTNNLNLNQWNHVAAVRSAGTLYLLINGVLSGSVALTTDLNNSDGQLTVAARHWDNDQVFTGYLSDLRITKGIARYDVNPTKLLAHFDSPPSILDAMGNTAGTGRTQPNIIPGGKYNNCAEYTTALGANPYLTIPTIGAVYTIEFFIKNRPGTIVSGYPLTLCFSPNDSSGYNFNIDVAGTTYFYNGSYLTFSFSVSTQMISDTWNHYAIVCDGSTIKLYLNGTLRETINSGFTLNATILQIGYNYWGASLYKANMLLDEIRISKVVRYSGDFTVPSAAFTPDSNTVALVRFDAAASGALIDATGRSLTVNGNVTISSTQSKFGGNSAFFDNTGNTYLTVPASPDFAFGTGDFTVECWLYMTSMPSTLGILDGRGGVVASPWVLVVSGPSPYSIWPANTFGWYNGAYNVTTGITPQLNTWYHVAVARKSGVTCLFVNGTAYLTVADTSNIVANDIRVGRAYDNTGYANIYIDELRITKGIARYSISGDALLLHMLPQTGFTEATGKSLSLFGSPSISTSIFKVGSSSLYLNGSSYLQDATQINLSSGSWTFEGWVRTGADVASTQFIYCSYTGSGAYYPFFYVVIVNSAFRVGSHLFTTDVPGVTLVPNSWYHIAVVINNGHVISYVDGVQRSDTVSTIHNSNLDFVIGAIKDVSYYSTGAYPLVGYLDEMRISNVARYSANFTPSLTPFSVDGSTKLLLHFEGLAGGAFPEDTGKSVSSFGNAVLSSAQSKFGGYSAYFDGAGDYLSVPSNIPDFQFGSDDFTIETWIYRTVAQDGMIVENLAGSNWQCYISNNKIYFYYTNPTAGVTILNLNQWYHLTWMRKSGILYMFVNGVMEASVPYPASTTGAGPMYIGSQLASSWWFAGYIDELRITKGKAHYSTAGFTPPNAPFTVHPFSVGVSDGSSTFPPTAPFVYSGQVTGDSLPPPDKFLSCL
jgi:hypothetical protein